MHLDLAGVQIFTDPNDMCKMTVLTSINKQHKCQESRSEQSVENSETDFVCLSELRVSWC